MLAYSSLWRSDLNWKERAYITISSFPKATVQVRTVSPLSAAIVAAVVAAAYMPLFTICPKLNETPLFRFRAGIASPDGIGPCAQAKFTAAIRSGQYGPNSCRTCHHTHRTTGSYTHGNWNCIFILNLYLYVYSYTIRILLYIRCSPFPVRAALHQNGPLLYKHIGESPSLDRYNTIAHSHVYRWNWRRYSYGEPKLQRNRIYSPRWIFFALDARGRAFLLLDSIKRCRSLRRTVWVRLFVSMFVGSAHHPQAHSSRTFKRNNDRFCTYA